MAASGIKAGQAYVELLANETPLERGLRKAEYQLRMFANQMTALGARLFGMGMAGSVPLWMSAKHFAELDDSLRLVKAVTGATEKEFDKLSEKARYLGRTTSFTSKQVADAMGELGRAGFKTREIDNMIDHVMNLSRATQTSIPIAANAAAAALRQFGMDSTETGRVVDVMTAAANNSAQTLEDIAVSFRYAAPVAKEFNMTIEDTAKLVGALANQGLRNEMAGTTLRNLMARIGSDDVQQKFKEIGVELRKEGVVRPISEILHDVGIQMNKLNMDALQRAEWFHRAFGLRSMAGGSKLVSQVFTDLNEALDNAADTAARTAHEMDAGLGGTLRLLTSAVQGLMESVGEALVGPLQKLGKWAMDTINHFSVWIKYNQQFIVSLGKFFGEITAIGAALLGLSAILYTIAPILGVIAAAIMALSTPIGATVAGLASLTAGFTLLANLLGIIKFDLNIFGQTYQTTMATAAEKTKNASDETDRLISKLKTLNDATNKTPDIMGEMVDIVQELTNRYGDLGLSINDVTNKVDGLAEAHNRLKEAQREEMLEAQKNVAIEARANQKRAQNQIDAIIKEHGPKGLMWHTLHDPLFMPQWDDLYSVNASETDRINKWRQNPNWVEWSDPKNPNTIYFIKAQKNKNILGYNYTDEKFGENLKKRLDLLVKDRDQFEKTVETSRDYYNELNRGGPFTASPMPSIGAGAMTPWTASPAERKGVEKILDEWGKNPSKQITKDDIAQFQNITDQLNSDLNDQAQAFQSQLSAYSVLPEAMLAHNIFNADFLGKFGFFAGQFWNDSQYINARDFLADSNTWTDKLETALSQEQDEGRKAYIAGYIELFKQFQRDYATHLQNGGRRETFNMTPYGDLFAFMAQLSFQWEEQRAKSVIDNAEKQLKKYAEANVKPELQSSYINEHLNPIKAQWQEYLGRMTGAKELNTKYSAMAQTYGKKTALEQLLQTRFEGSPELKALMTFIDSNSGTQEEQRIRAIEKQANEQIANIDKEVKDAKDTGRLGFMNNGQWEEISDWDKWGEDQKKRINDIKDKQIAEINASIDEPMADAIQGAWETGTTTYDQRLSDLNSQIADVIMRRRSAAVAGNWGAMDSLDWEQKQLEYSKAQTEYNRAIAYSSYVEKQRAQAVTDYNQALKTYKDSENLPDNDPAKVAAAKALNTAKENLGKWDRDVESATDAIDRTASNLDKLSGIQEVADKAYTITTQTAYSSLGTFNPFEMGGFEQTTIKEELKTQTTLLSEIRDNTEELGDDTWL